VLQLTGSTQYFLPVSLPFNQPQFSDAPPIVMADKILAAVETMPKIEQVSTFIFVDISNAFCITEFASQN
jgi:hypothetical protein